MNEAILVRHAESEANALGIVNGDPSIPYALDAARLRPDDPEILCDAGTLLAAAGRASEGIPLLERALALRPGFARAQENLARARLGSGLP